MQHGTCEKRYRFEPINTYRRLVIVHPEVERILGEGVCRLAEMDIFEPIPGRYDLILSFNLLQPSYFPAAKIDAGVRNLALSLCEGGLLIIGNDWEILPRSAKGEWLAHSSPEIGKRQPTRFRLLILLFHLVLYCPSLGARLGQLLARRSREAGAGLSTPRQCIYARSVDISCRPSSLGVQRSLRQIPMRAGPGSIRKGNGSEITQSMPCWTK